MYVHTYMCMCADSTCMYIYVYVCIRSAMRICMSCTIGMRTCSCPMLCVRRCAGFAPCQVMSLSLLWLAAKYFFRTLSSLAPSQVLLDCRVLNDVLKAEMLNATGASQLSYSAHPCMIQAASVLCCILACISMRLIIDGM